jgi:hypothetical protein
VWPSVSSIQKEGKLLRWKQHKRGKQVDELFTNLNERRRKKSTLIKLEMKQGILQQIS